MDCRFYLLVCFLLALVTADPHERIRRQSEENSTTSTTTTTAKPPPKRRPSNIFRLFSTLLAETRDDTRRAFSEIGNIFNSQFTTTPNSATTTVVSNSTESATGDESSTTEAYRITRDEFNGILMSNLRGIGQLFRQELRTAIRDSNRNVREFGREFRKQLRPYVEVRNKRLS